VSGVFVFRLDYLALLLFFSEHDCHFPNMV
jgi:hypothetical protein